jgi:hypothetical protein
MNPSKVAPVVLALLCIAAIGVSATTLESSLSTDPDEEIDLSYEHLPIGEDDAAALQEEMEGSKEEETVEVASAADSEEEASDRQPASSSSESEAPSESSREEATGTGPTPPSLLDRLLALLRVLAVVLVVAALAIRYRERILAVLSALFESAEDEAGADAEATADPWPDAEPSNVVDRAWVALVREVDPERPAVMTPSECAAAAREAGLDAATVEAITGAFERVNYGGVDVSAERDRAAEALRRLPTRVRDAGAVDSNHAPSNDGRRRGDAGGDR